MALTPQQSKEEDEQDKYLLKLLLKLKSFSHIFNDHYTISTVVNNQSKVVYSNDDSKLLTTMIVNDTYTLLCRYYNSFVNVLLKESTNKVFVI